MSVYQSLVDAHRAGAIQTQPLGRYLRQNERNNFRLSLLCPDRYLYTSAYTDWLFVRSLLGIGDITKAWADWLIYSSNGRVRLRQSPFQGELILIERPKRKAQKRVILPIVDGQVSMRKLHVYPGKVKADAQTRPDLSIG